LFDGGEEELIIESNVGKKALGEDGGKGWRKKKEKRG